jgi:putative membrane protein
MAIMRTADMPAAFEPLRSGARGERHAPADRFGPRFEPAGSIPKGSVEKGPPAPALQATARNPGGGWRAGHRSGADEEAAAMMWWYYPGHMGAWGWFGMTVSTLLLVALLIAAGLLVVRAARHAGGPAGPPSSPERILAERYARGEIDEEEYRRRLETLQHAGARTP